MQKTISCLMIWHVGLQQYVWWPDGRRKLFGTCVQAANMSHVIYTDWGWAAPLYLHRVSKAGTLLKELGPLRAMYTREIDVRKADVQKRAAKRRAMRAEVRAAAPVAVAC